MLVQQVKEPIAKGNIIYICKNQYQNSTFLLKFENFSPGTTMVSPIVGFGYERMSSTSSANSA